MLFNMPGVRASSVATILVALVLLQAWQNCQGLERMYIHDSQYYKTFMKVDGTGAEAIINPKTKDLDQSDQSITIHLFRIEEKTYGKTISLSSKEFSLKDERKYNDIPAYSATAYGSIQQGTMSLTYTLFTDPVKHGLKQEGDVWIDLAVQGWKFCVEEACTPPKESFLEITLIVETKAGSSFQSSKSNMVDTNIYKTAWDNTKVPVTLYSMKSAKLDGVATDIQMTTTNTTANQLTYKIRTPAFTNNFTYTAIWAKFARSMPKSAAQQTYPWFIALLTPLAVLLKDL